MARRERLIPEEIADNAACKGKGKLFFPPHPYELNEAKRIRHRAAKAICAECPVRDQCRDYAVKYHIRDGIYGGLTEKERVSFIRTKERQSG
jgi:WhiB family redox-sensing transcriptional regulator